MREGSFAAAAKANIGTAQLGGRNRTIGWAVSVIRSKARQIWRNKTAVELAARTGLSLHTTEKILSGERGMGLDAFAALLASAEGVEFFGAVIDAMPASARARWEQEFADAAERAVFRRRAAEVEAERVRLAERNRQRSLDLT